MFFLRNVFFFIILKRYNIIFNGNIMNFLMINKKNYFFFVILEDLVDK